MTSAVYAGAPLTWFEDCWFNVAFMTVRYIAFVELQVWILRQMALQSSNVCEHGKTPSAETATG
jgi:hypothetical protein